MPRVEYGLDFEWDSETAASNAARHGVTFEGAASVFDDEWALTVPDVVHSQAEFREFTIGYAHSGRLLAVAHTPRGERTRIIRTRHAERPEARQYAGDQG